MKLLPTKPLNTLKWTMLVLVGLNLENLAEFFGIDKLMISFFTAPEVFAWLFTPKATYIYLLILAFLMGLGWDESWRKFKGKKEQDENQELTKLGEDAHDLSEKLEAFIYRASERSSFNMYKYDAEIDLIRERLSQKNISLLMKSDMFRIQDLEQGEIIYIERLSAVLMMIGTYLKAGELGRAQKRAEAYQQRMRRLRADFELFA